MIICELQKSTNQKIEIGSNCSGRVVMQLLCPMQVPGRNAPLIQLLILVLCIYCLLVYIVCFPTYKSFFLHFFLTYLLLYLSFPLRIDSLHFQAR